MIAWGAQQFYRNIIAPVLEATGVDADSDRVAPALTFVGLVGLVGIVMLIASRVSSQNLNQQLTAKVEEQSAIINELRARLPEKPQDGTVSDG